MSDMQGFERIDAAPAADMQGFERIEPAKPADAGEGFWTRMWHGLRGADVSRAGRFGMGVADPAYGAAQIGARMPSGQGGGLMTLGTGLDEQINLDQPHTLPNAADVDRTVQQREQSYRQREQTAGLGGGPASEWPRLLGNVVGTAPLTAATGTAAPATMGGRLAVGTALGAAGGLLEPAAGEKEDYWTQKEKQLAAGAAAGIAASAAGSAAGRVLAPRLGGDAATLASQGVQLTPARMMPGGAIGRFAQRVEDKLTSFPVLGDFIENMREHTLNSFNRATLNQALEPIGASLPRGTQMGNVAVRQAGDAISQAYNVTLKRLPAVTLDRDLREAVRQIGQEARQRPAVYRDLARTVGNLFVNKMKRGPISGVELNRAASELGRQARELGHSEDFFRRELGRHLRDARSALIDAAERQYPDVAPDLRSASAAWAMLTRVENAAGRRAASNGVFTPMDLLQAVKSDAGGVRRREFARGDALFQNWAQAAQRLLPSGVPTSGTAERLRISQIPLGAAGLMVGAPYRFLGSRWRSLPSTGLAATAEGARAVGVGAAPAAGGAVAPTNGERRRLQSYPWEPTNQR
jgi:hypothetical protein